MKKKPEKKGPESGWAILFNAIGAVCMYWGVKTLIAGSLPGLSIGLIALAAGCMALGDHFNRQKKKETAFEEWWDQIKAANLESQIIQSQSVAVQVFKKNPQKRTLKKIRKLNPSAAAYIEQKMKK